MKVIDLLNKINNGDNMPKKIWLDSKEFEYDELEKFYQDENKIDLLEQRKIYSTYDFLNFEVIILDKQEENTINIHDIEKLNSEYVMSDVEFQIQDKLNELLFAIKQLDKEVKEIKIWNTQKQQDI